MKDFAITYVVVNSAKCLFDWITSDKVGKMIIGAVAMSGAFKSLFD